MDPLSILGSVAGVATAGTQVSIALLDLISTVRHAPEDMQAVAEEMSILTSCLELLHETLIVAQHLAKPKFLTDVQRSINNIKVTQEKLSRLIEEDSMSILKRLKWLKSKDLLEEIKSHKLTITLQASILSAAIIAKPSHTSSSTVPIPAPEPNRFMLQAENLVRAGQFALLARSRRRSYSDFQTARPPSPPLPIDHYYLDSAEPSTEAKAKAAQDYQNRTKTNGEVGYANEGESSLGDRISGRAARQSQNRARQSHHVGAGSTDPPPSDSAANNNPDAFGTTQQELEPLSFRVADFGSSLRLHGDAATFLYKLVFQGGATLDDLEADSPTTVLGGDEEEDSVGSDKDYDDNSEVSLEPNVTFKRKQKHRDLDLLAQPRTKQRFHPRRVVGQLLLEWTATDGSKTGPGNTAPEASQSGINNGQTQTTTDSDRYPFPPAPYVEDYPDSESELGGEDKMQDTNQRARSPSPHPPPVFLGSRIPNRFDGRRDGGNRGDGDIFTSRGPRGVNYRSSGSKMNKKLHEKDRPDRPVLYPQPEGRTGTQGYYGDNDFRSIPLDAAYYSTQPQVEHNAVPFPGNLSTQWNPSQFHGGPAHASTAPGWPQWTTPTPHTAHQAWPKIDSHNGSTKPSIIILPPTTDSDPLSLCEPPKLDVVYKGFDIRLQGPSHISNPDEYTARHGLHGKAIMGSLAGERTLNQDDGMTIYASLVLGHSMKLLYIRGSDLGETWFLDSEPVHVHFYHCGYQPQFYPAKDDDDEAAKREYVAVSEEHISNEALAELGIRVKCREGGRVLLDPTVTWFELRDAFKLTFQLRWRQQYRKFRSTFHKSIATFRMTHCDERFRLQAGSTSDTSLYPYLSAFGALSSGTMGGQKATTITGSLEPAQSIDSSDAVAPISSGASASKSKPPRLEIGLSQASTLTVPQSLGSATILGTPSASEVDVLSFQVDDWDETQADTKPVENTSVDLKVTPEPGPKKMFSRIARWKLGRTKEDASVAGIAAS